jgi:acetyl-CoA carboxylase biotin carboxyl carrier protein
MALSDEDIREILRIIDESSPQEVRIETEGFSLHVRKDGAGPAEPAEPPAPVQPEQPHVQDERLVTIEAPMLGTFFLAEGPGQPPFVEVGSRVGPDTTVCIIEVMKMMNSVAAGVTGIVAEVCEENGQFVEEGQPLFRVAPA